MSPTANPSRHRWSVASASHDTMPADIDVRCHRLLRGPYTGGGALLRAILPDLLASDGPMLAAHAAEIVTVAPDLTPLIPAPPQTLTYLASRAERTRFYAAGRSLRVAHGVAELLIHWARTHRPQGVVVAFRELDEADHTDRELLAVLLRRCPPRELTLIVETAGHSAGTTANADADKTLEQALADFAEPGPALAPGEGAVRVLEGADGVDLAQLFIDADGTSGDPRVLAAYAALDDDERARRHSERAAVLKRDEVPAAQFGALLYHLERGVDPAAAAVTDFLHAVEDCFDRGLYEAALDMAQRGRAACGGSGFDRPRAYWNFTNKIGACLSYLRRGQKGFDYFDELRRGTTDPAIHMNACYMMAMLYTRHLPKGMHDEYRALEWVNTAIAIADLQEDPHRRVFVGAFMRNAKALVEMHRDDLPAALALVNEAIAMTDADLGPDEQLLHRSVLVYNRAQVLAAMGEHEGSLRDYDLVITRDPDYGDYYFERAGERRAAGRPDDALADYAKSIELSPPFHEAHFNRADLLRELGRDEEALRDLDYAVILDPEHVDTRVNRADLLMLLGDPRAAHADIEYGLRLDPHSANLLTARGALLEAEDDAEGARAAYDTALSANPEFAAAWVNRAVLSYSSGRPADAVADLDRAIELNDSPLLRANRAVALQDLGEHERVLADLEAAVAALADDDPDLYYRRGLSRWMLGDRDGALADWRAHLAAYAQSAQEPGEAVDTDADADGISPFAAQIAELAGDLIIVPGAAATTPVEAAA